MASTVLTNVDRGLTVGGVLARSIDVIKTNPLATLGVSFALTAVPQLLLAATGSTVAMMTSLRAGLYAAIAGYGLIVAMLWMVASGAMVQATVAHAKGRQATPGEVIQVGIVRSLPLIAVYFLLIVGVWIGTIFLIVPGIMLGVMWSVALPAVVAERTGVFGAFGRSRALTKGARWQIFGILLLIFAIYLLVTMAVAVVSTAGGGTFAAILTRGAVAQPSIIAQLFSTLVTTVMVTWLTTVGASLFVELRNWKDGPDAADLADIFA